jgi:hypothetical protein
MRKALAARFLRRSSASMTFSSTAIAGAGQPGRRRYRSADAGKRLRSSRPDHNCRVGAGVIDAYAGALGVLGGFAGDEQDIGRHLALIAGTSSCVMAMSPEPQPFAGVWGPYYGAALPAVAVGRRPVGDRRPARPHHPLARRRRRAGCRHAPKSPACRRTARHRRARTSPHGCMCCPISMATARPSPIRMPWVSSAG